jgi:SAM-dependent methyltransferase
MCDLPFEDNFADYIETVDAIEHISFWKINNAFSEMYRVLKPGGKLSLITTNFDQLARLWTKTVEGKPLEDHENMKQYCMLMAVIYGNQVGGDNGGEFHRIPFNPLSMGYHLRLAGFDPKKFTITIYPMNGPTYPPIKTMKIEKGSKVLTEMMHVEAIK